MSADALALLGCWERARPLPRPWRELALLELIEAGTAEDHARLPIGERDRRLLDLHTALSGGQIDCETDCPACGERLALALDAASLRAGPSSSRGRTIRHAGRRIGVRPPDSRDIAACLSADDPEAALMDRCTDIRGGPVPDDLRERITRIMAELDPGAEILLDTRCPACGEAWQVPLDPAALALAEVEHQAMRLLREVDQLARTYGWCEDAVLRLSAQRRRAYVALAAQ